MRGRAMSCATPRGSPPDTPRVLPRSLGESAAHDAPMLSRARSSTLTQSSSAFADGTASLTSFRPPVKRSFSVGRAAGVLSTVPEWDRSDSPPPDMEDTAPGDPNDCSSDAKSKKKSKKTSVTKRWGALLAKIPSLFSRDKPTGLETVVEEDEDTRAPARKAEPLSIFSRSPSPSPPRSAGRRDPAPPSDSATRGLRPRSEEMHDSERHHAVASAMTTSPVPHHHLHLPPPPLQPPESHPPLHQQQQQQQHGPWGPVHTHRPVASSLVDPNQTNQMVVLQAFRKCVFCRKTLSRFEDAWSLPCGHVTHPSCVPCAPCEFRKERAAQQRNPMRGRLVSFVDEQCTPSEPPSPEDPPATTRSRSGSDDGEVGSGVVTLSTSLASSPTATDVHNADRRGPRPTSDPAVGTRRRSWAGWRPTNRITIDDLLASVGLTDPPDGTASTAGSDRFVSRRGSVTTDEGEEYLHMINHFSEASVALVHPVDGSVHAVLLRKPDAFAPGPYRWEWSYDDVDRCYSAS